MNILLVTQKIDVSDPILGFFHRWIKEFAVNCEHVHAVAQYTDLFDLPDNVFVHSLKKEKGSYRIVQILRYWKYLIKYRKDYDVILVHMTPIWVVLGFPVSLILRKRVMLWYEARGTRWPLKFSTFIVKKIFSASEHGMPLNTKKSVLMGHGIDSDQFSMGGHNDKNQLVTIGRITKSKQLILLLNAFLLMPERFNFSIIGVAITKEDKEFLKEIKEFLLNNGIENRVIIKSMTQEQVVPLLKNSFAFLHASTTSLDKAVLEAMSCGCPVVSLASAVHSSIPEECRAVDASSIAESVSYLSGLSGEEYNALSNSLRSDICTKHSLSSLIKRLVEEMA